MTRDKYIVRNAGAVGPNSTSYNTNIQERNENTLDDIDLLNLASQLEMLKKSMQLSAENTVQIESLAAVSAAADAAKKGDGSTTIIMLKKAGEWAFDTATKIGVSIASEALKKAIF